MELGVPLLEEVKHYPDRYMLVDRNGEQVMRPEHFIAKIEQAMIKAGAREMLGIAPAGDLERKIQQHLDEMKQEQAE